MMASTSPVGSRFGFPRCQTAPMSLRSDVVTIRKSDLGTSLYYFTSLTKYQGLPRTFFQLLVWLKNWTLFLGSVYTACLCSAVLEFSAHQWILPLRGI